MWKKVLYISRLTMCHISLYESRSVYLKVPLICLCLLCILVSILTPLVFDYRTCLTASCCVPVNLCKPLYPLPTIFGKVGTRYATFFASHEQVPRGHAGPKQVGLVRTPYFGSTRQLCQAVKSQAYSTVRFLLVYQDLIMSVEGKSLF